MDSAVNVDQSLRACLQGQRVALTGRMISMTRREAAALVRRCGGEFCAEVVRNTSMLVVGEEGWPLKPNGRLTAKLRRAQALREQGCPIEVLAEECFLQRVGLHEQAQSVCGSYSFAELARILRISRRRLSALVDAGLVQPLASDNGLTYFDFRQASRVRAVLELLSSGVALQNIRRSLQLVGRCLPQAAASQDWLSRLEVKGKRVLLRSANGELLEPTGQMVMDFSGAEPSRTECDSVLPLESDPFQEALCLQESGKLQEAIAAYRGLLAEEGFTIGASFNLGNALYAAGEKAAAAERFRQVTELDPDLVEAWNNLGNVLAELGQMDEALAAYRRAVELDPSYPDAQYGLADLLDETGQTQEAAAHWQAYLALESQGPHADYARRRLASQRPHAG